MSNLVFLALGFVVSLLYSIVRFDLLEEETFGMFIEKLIVCFGTAMLLKEFFT